MDIISFVHKNNNYSIIISIIYVRDDINSDVILHVALICLNRYCLKFICLFFLIFFVFVYTPLSNALRLIICPHWRDFL